MVSSEFWSVPRMWQGETCFIVAGGPSLSRFDLSVLRGQHIIAINNAYQICPTAEILYFCDAKWFQWHRDDARFINHTGIKVKLTPRIGEKDMKQYRIKLLQDYTSQRRRENPSDDSMVGGLELSADGVRTGRNSGYQCINLAFHTGARRIVLLGYDMRQASNGAVHWHPEHPIPTKPSVFQSAMLKHFATLVEPLREHGVEVLNATPDSAIDCFPRVKLADLLQQTS